jgi:thiol-disulfide isomerase/thioredoxin
MHKNYISKIVLLATLTFSLGLPALAGAAPQKGKRLPAFEATTVDGKKISPSTYAGKVVMISITDNSCDACKKAIPLFNELSKTYGNQGFQMLGFHFGAKIGIEEVKALINDYKVGFTMALIDEKIVKNTLGIFGVPCYILLDKKGTIAGIYRYRSFNDANFKLIEKQVKLSLSE